MKNIFLIAIIIFFSTGSFSQTFQWAKSVNSTLTRGEKVVCDATGNIFTTGLLSSNIGAPTDMDFGPGVFNLTPGIGNSNAYIAKYDPNGNFIWAKLIFAQNYNNFIQELGLDKDNNVIVIGSFKGTIDFDPGPGIFFLTNNNLNNYEQVFIEKFDSNGNMLWVKQIGDSVGHTLHSSFCITPEGSVVVIGSFFDSIDFDPNLGTYMMNATGNNSNSFILKLDNLGQFIWAKQFSGSINNGKKIACDNNNNLYLMGDFQTIIDADPNIGITNLIGTALSNIYIVKLDSSANFLWAKSLANMNLLSAILVSDIHIDKGNGVYFTGRFTDSVDFDPNLGVDLHFSIGANDAFVSKLDTLGNYIWSKTFGGLLNEDLKQMIIDSTGNIYLMGFYNGLVDFDPSAGGIYNLYASQNSAYINKLDSMGNFAQVLTFIQPNPIGNILPRAFCKDSNDNIYLTGFFDGTADFNPGVGIYNITSPAPGNYMFITKLSVCGINTNITYTYCDSANLWGLVHDSSEHFVQMFSDDNGCDSNMNIDLIILHSTTDTLLQTECKNFTINNITYNTAGFHSQIYPNFFGCDSLFVIDLTLLNTGIGITQNMDTLVVTPLGFTYQWIDCTTNMPISGATNSYFVPSVAGSYKAVVYFSVECSDTTQCKFVPVGISEPRDIRCEMSYYNHRITYTNNTNYQLYAKVYDMLGRVLQELTIQKGITNNEIVICTSGIYFITLMHENSVIKTEKILVE